MPTDDDHPAHGFSVSEGGGRRRWTEAEMRRAVPLPTPTPTAPVTHDLPARVVSAAMRRLAASGTVSVDDIAQDLREPSTAVAFCIERLASAEPDDTPIDS